MPEKKAEEDFEVGTKSRAGICPQCGGPVVHTETMSGTKYLVSVTDTAIQAYFKNASDIDWFVHDRLHRAEKIIIALRREVEQLRKLEKNR